MMNALRLRPTPVAPPFRNSRPAGVSPGEVRSLAPVEALVLSRVDGLRSVEDIARIVGLTPRETLQILRALLAANRLATLGKTAPSEPTSEVRVRSAAPTQPTSRPPLELAEPLDVSTAAPTLERGRERARSSLMNPFTAKTLAVPVADAFTASGLSRR
jgi:hypothetical protein